MPVLVNFKICDNSEACSGISVCPTKAFKWNEEKKTIEIDNEKCINCGLCAKSCPVGAIKFAKDEEELKKIKKEIDDDPRTLKDLMVDRYGGQPINDNSCCSQDELPSILTTKKPCLIELFNDDSIECLVMSIPIKQIMKETKEFVYNKLEADDGILKKYDIKELPSLLIFENNKLLGKIEGYYPVVQKEEFVKKINDILNKE